MTEIAKLPVFQNAVHKPTPHNTAASVKLWEKENNEIVERERRFRCGNNAALSPKQKGWTRSDDRCYDPRI